MMPAPWKFQSMDGEISRISLVSENYPNLSCSIGEKPHETAKCVFKILSLKNASEDGKPISSCYLDQLNLSDSTNPTHMSLSVNKISTVVGISSVTEFDRLIDVCLMKMVREEIVEFEIQCYKNQLIIVIKLQLVSFEATTELHEMMPEELLHFASQLKADGVKLFLEQRLVDAFHKFRQGIKYLTLIDSWLLQKNLNSEILETKQKLLSTLQCNTAGCHVAHKNWDSAIELCNLVLEVEPNNIKALFRRGISLLETREYERARQDFNVILDLEPNNSTVKSKLSLLDEREKLSNQKYASAMKKMFGP